MARWRRARQVVEGPAHGVLIAVALATAGVAMCSAAYASGITPAARKATSLTEQGPKLSGTGEVGHGAFGDTVALSGDGTTAIVGAPQDKNATGAVWVFVRSGNSWEPQGGKITASGESKHGFFGIGVALSQDGNTALVGSAKDAKGEGAAYVFTRSAGVWTQRARLTGAEEIGHANFGRRVALSDNGQTALIGGFADSDNVGAAWVFARSGESWSQLGPKLTGTSEVGAGQFGADVALSGDGETALIGGPTDNGAAGAVWFFARSGEMWAPQGAKVTTSSEVGAAEFGRSLSLTDDGGTALIGGPADGGGVGAAWVFTRSGEAWSQSSELTGPPAKGHGDFGTDVALAGNGESALIGAPKAHIGEGGAAWLFTLQGGEWARQSEPLTGGAETKHSDFGRSVTLSQDGATAFVGGPKDHKLGAAWAYAN
jgi:hypothetical protein